MVQKLTYSIENATENSCPTIPKKTVNKNIPWWNPLLADTRKELNALHRKHQNTPNERVYVNYKKVLRRYKKLCFKAKTRHRRLTNEIIPDESKMTKHIKALSEQIYPQIGSVIKPDGSNSLIGKDTHDIILNTHFPKHTDIKKHRI